MIRKSKVFAIYELYLPIQLLDLKGLIRLSVFIIPRAGFWNMENYSHGHLVDWTEGKGPPEFIGQSFVLCKLQATLFKNIT